MSEKRFNIVNLLETLAISDNNECKYYQNSNDDFKKLCELLNDYEDKYAHLLWEYNGLGCEYDGLKKENEQLQQSTVFTGEDKEHYQRWTNQIKEYIEDDHDFDYNEDFIIKLALAYTLQSLRAGESLKRFQRNDL